MAFEIKIVPDAMPNADGEWLRIEEDLPRSIALSRSSRFAFDILQIYAPKNHHIVSYRKIEEQQ